MVQKRWGEKKKSFQNRQEFSRPLGSAGLYPPRENLSIFDFFLLFISLPYLLNTGIIYTLSCHMSHLKVLFQNYLQTFQNIRNED